LTIHDNGDNITTNYQAVELQLHGRMHNISGMVHDGEMVILHRPTTSALKLYCCFPFAHKEDSPETEIDNIILSKTSTISEFKKISLEMNKYINNIPIVHIHEKTDKFGEQCIVVVFENIIHINQNIKLALNDKLFKDSNIINSSILNYKKNYQDLIMLEDVLRTPSSLIEEGFEGDDNEVIYKCEYLPVDSEDMVQVLQVPIGSPGHSSLVGNELSSLFLNNGIFVFAVILIFSTST
jgi:hypothetical protein